MKTTRPQSRQTTSEPPPPTDYRVSVGSTDLGTTFTCGAWSMTRFAAQPEGEPLIRDIDAATRLGFARPRDIRKIIERIWPENQRPCVRATVARTQMPTGGMRETTVQEFWLTEAQLLKIIARSETKIAEAILDEMITVYMAVRRHLVPTPHPAGPALTAADLKAFADAFTAVVGEAIRSAIQPVAEHTLRTNHRVDDIELRVRAEEVGRAARVAEVEHLRAELAALKQQVSTETIGPEGAALVLGTLRRIASLYTERKQQKRVRRRVENQIRKALGFDGRGSHWRFLPKRDAARAEKLLGMALDEHIALTKGSSKGGAQLEIPLKN